MYTSCVLWIAPLYAFFEIYYTYKKKKKKKKKHKKKLKKKILIIKKIYHIKSIKLNVKKTFVIFSSFSTLKLKIIKYAFSNILEKKARQELG